MTDERTRASPGWQLLAHSLSGRLLMLTALFIMSSVALVYFPSVARYHHQLMTDRVRAAELAVLPLTEPSGSQLPQSLREQLLRHAGVAAVILAGGGAHKLYLIGNEPPPIKATFNADDTSLLDESGDVLNTLFAGPDRSIRINGSTQLRGAISISVITNEAPIRQALFDFSWRVLSLSLFISGVTAGLVFVVLYLTMVQPMKRMTEAMSAFRESPEDARLIISPSARRDEIGTAEREFAAMQRALYAFLQQRAHLAALGTAVAKIQHDLRNILTTAQLASDRLSSIEDPVVKGQTERLMAALDRAVALATSTLRYGKAEERAPERKRFPLAPFVAEVGASAIPEGCKVSLTLSVPADVEIDADTEQLFRILMNLMKNAREALEGAGRDGAMVTVEARRKSDTVMVTVIDNGPGIPEKARERLFLPFGSTARTGGTGLGLAIARELAHAHGGDVELVRTGPEGTRFRVSIPDRAV